MVLDIANIASDRNVSKKKYERQPRAERETREEWQVKAKVVPDDDQNICNQKTRKVRS